MVPTSTWGKNYIAGHTFQRMLSGTPLPDYWRVTALQENTTLTYSPSAPAGAPTTLGAGESVEFSSATDFAVSGDKPISLTQFMSSSYQADPEAEAFGAFTDCTAETDAQNQYCTSTTGYLSNCTGFEDDWLGTSYVCTPLGDPSMMVVPPVEQYRKDYIFLTPLDYQMDFITVIAPDNSNITMDGHPLPAQGWVAAGSVGETAYRRLAMQVERGVHKLVSDKPVGLIVYGMDRDVSYGYPAGLDLTRLNTR